MEDAGKKRVEFPPCWVYVCLLPRTTNQSVSHIWTVHGDRSPGSELPHLLQLLEFSLLPSLPGCPSPLLYGLHGCLRSPGTHPFPRHPLWIPL